MMWEPVRVGGVELSLEGIMNAASPSKLVVRQLRIMSLALGLWAALVLLFATQFVLIGSFSWREALRQALFFWGLWVLWMPTTALLAFGLPFERSRMWRWLGVHLLGCVLVVTISQIALRHFVPSPFPPPGVGFRKGPLFPESPPPELRPPNGFLGLRAGLDILVYWSLVGVCQGIANFRRSQQRERRAVKLEAQLTRSKLQALRMQINPHFLFNTLNAISTLIYVNQRAADEMLGDLSDLLRRSLDSAEEQEIPLFRELEFVRAYIGIEQKRFGARLCMEQEVPQELFKALVPALILQPLVENAIRHGIEPQRAPGLITIQAKREGPQLLLAVHDNGKGQPTKAPVRSESRGIGLANIKGRLQELYGPDQQFTLMKGEPRGCTVEIRLPYHTEPLQIEKETTRATEV